MKTIKYIKLLFCITVLPLLTSCANFLDVNPKAEVLNKDLFETDEGVEDALYGVYSTYRGNEIYGKYISVLYPEAMSRNFTARGGGGLDYLSHGDFENGSARTLSNATWKRSYQAIGYVNNIIQNLEEISPTKFRHYNLYKGEALALRAMLHFDLVRLFAVDYNANDREAWNKAIPYVTRYSYDITPYYTVGEVYNKVIKDLKDAEICLEEDRQLVQAERTNVGTEFTDCRIIHMNLYAAQALLARVYWMKQDLDSAAIYAKKVIDSQKFPLMASSDFVQFEKGVLNMKETIFGLYAPTYASNCYSIFGKSSGTDMLTLNSEYEDLYINTQGPTPEGSDLRFSAWFGSTLEVSPACVKMINAMFDGGSTESQYSGESYLGVSLIRIPEMYYIMAEALLVKDPEQATVYFDKVIESRGMVKFADRSEGQITADDIYIERRKEYYGEGQQWFNMKRLKKDIQISESNVLDGRVDRNYKMLIPTDEDLRENYD
ncbi:RagB/SusD family nutrient uptake outer membrane protein [Coprobacter sp.]